MSTSDFLIGTIVGVVITAIYFNAKNKSMAKNFASNNSTTAVNMGFDTDVNNPIGTNFNAEGKNKKW